MSITKDDLDAIQHVLQPMLDKFEDKMTRRMGKLEDRMISRMGKLEDRMISRMGKLDDDMALRTENGLQEVRIQVQAVSSDIEKVSDQVGRIEMQQRAMVNQLDNHSVRLNRVENKLKLKAA